MQDVPLTTVTVTYRSAATLPGCLARLRRLHEERLANVVIVDNASTDHTPEILRREASWANVILSPENLGFGRGCNLGLNEVRTPYALFLNPDAVLEPAAARSLLDFMERTPAAGICGPAIRQDSKLEPYQVAGDRPTPWTVIRAALPRGRGPRLEPVVPGSPPRRCGWVCGAALMIRTEVARELRGFDPRFFLYFEETDLCLRAERRGWQTWAVGEAIAGHVGGASIPSAAFQTRRCISRYYYESRMYYMTKHHGRVAAVASELAELVLVGAVSVADVVRRRNPSRLRERLQGPVLRLPAEVTG